MLKHLRPVVFLLCALPTLARAQEAPQPEPPPPPGTSSISINVRMVGFDALVRDKHGVLLHNLTKDDFNLTEDDKPQSIRYFTEDNDLPLTVGLLIDTSGSQSDYFAEQAISSKTFLTKMLTRPQDNAFVVRFDATVFVLQKMTTELPRLEAALGHLRTPYPVSGYSSGTHLFDAICAVTHRAFGDLHGRRAIVILTDGEDTASSLNRDYATQCAQIANVAVYTVLYTSRDPIVDGRFDPSVFVYPNEHLPGRTNMERISRATGGRVFVVGKSNKVETIYAQIENDLRSQYRIGYTPPPSPPATYHTLQLKPKDKHLKVQTRLGYYTPKQ